MELDIRGSLESCREAVHALRIGAGGAENVCIETRTLLLLAQLAASAYASLLTPELQMEIREVLAAAAEVSTDWLKSGHRNRREAGYAERACQRIKDFDELATSLPLSATSHAPLDSELHAVS